MDTQPHTFVIDIVPKEIPRGFPLSSSSITNRFPEGLRKDRGIWFLEGKKG